MVVSMVMGVGATIGECAAVSTSALTRAQGLEAPSVASTYRGEMEGVDFWAEHDELLEEARKEWGRRHPILYEVSEEFMKRFLDPRILHAIGRKSIGMLQALFHATEKEGVYTIQVFTSEFVSLFLDELAYQEASRIPMRRPNGMNRYGCLLSQVGFGSLVETLSDLVFRPMAHVLFPNRVAAGDISSDYGFVVQYHPDADTNLAEHADASTVTINVCLQPATDAAPLYFKSVRGIRNADTEVAPTNVSLAAPGMAVVHLGQHVHGVYNVTSARSNMVVWLMGDNDYVRVAPYNTYEVVSNTAAWRSYSGWNE
jgi:hypothetical protein